jgi:hypothetical protein
MLQVLCFRCCAISCKFLRIRCSPLAHTALRWLLPRLQRLQHLLLLLLWVCAKAIALQATKGTTATHIKVSLCCMICTLLNAFAANSANCEHNNWRLQTRLLHLQLTLPAMPFTIVGFKQKQRQKNSTPKQPHLLLLRRVGLAARCQLLNR